MIFKFGKQNPEKIQIGRRFLTQDNFTCNYKINLGELQVSGICSTQIVTQLFIFKEFNNFRNNFCIWETKHINVKYFKSLKLTRIL